ncbi:UNVERIFIED_CONTAM: hypothetical protein Cloal_0684 [Acetivibrio alkalicellulosi]
MDLKIFKGYERFDDHYPSNTVKYALENKEKAIPELLNILNFTLENVSSLYKDSKYLIHFPAVYLLSYFRETRAYETIIKLAKLKDEVIFGLFGDTVTEDLKKIFASLYDGNITFLKEIIENSSIDENIRCEALESLLILLNLNDITREELVFYFKELMNGKLEKDYSFVWETLVNCCCLIHPKGLIDNIKDAVNDGKVESFLIDWSLMETNSKRTVKDVLGELKKDEYYSIITKEDVLALEEWVGGFNFDKDDEYDEQDDDEYDDWFDNYDYDKEYYIKEHDNKIDIKTTKYSNNLITIPFFKEIRTELNSPCHCGSNKKYKNCCFFKDQNMRKG